VRDRKPGVHAPQVPNILRWTGIGISTTQAGQSKHVALGKAVSPVSFWPWSGKIQEKNEGPVRALALGRRIEGWCGPTLRTAQDVFARKSPPSGGQVTRSGVSFGGIAIALGCGFFVGRVR
jgi:hypothetical protein